MVLLVVKLPVPVGTSSSSNCNNTIVVILDSGICSTIVFVTTIKFVVLGCSLENTIVTSNDTGRDLPGDPWYNLYRRSVRQVRDTIVQFVSSCQATIVREASGTIVPGNAYKGDHFYYYYY